MSEDIEYLANYQHEKLYVNPGSKGAYATIVGDSDEVILGEVQVTAKSRVAVSAFYVKDRSDFGSFKIVKLKHHATRGWSEDGSVRVNQFQLAQIDGFLSLIGQLDLSDTQKTRLSLKDLQIGSLNALLRSDQGEAILKKLAESPDLQTDIYAVAGKRKAVAEFEEMLGRQSSESSWQQFFERNSWIFGHGLNYVFLDGVSDKLEATTTGATFDQSGKRVDALMRTRAEISQYVLVELKRSDTPLLASSTPYRSGCWGVSPEVSNAVTQVQKTTHEFAKHRFRDVLKDHLGNEVGPNVYSIDPKSYLIVGCLAELLDNPDKIACFELYRRNIRSPDIITFDELFARAKCILENVSFG